MSHRAAVILAAIDTGAEKVGAFLKRPEVRLTVAFVAAAGVYLYGADIAQAAFPLPGLDRTRMDVEEELTTRGGPIGCVVGLGAAGLRMLVSNFEMGAGGFLRSAGAGGMMGASPTLGGYFTAG